jgi:hypothetical protein
MDIMDEIVQGFTQSAGKPVDDTPTVVVGFNTGTERRYKLDTDGSVFVKQYNPNARNNKYWSDWKPVTAPALVDAITTLVLFG